MEQKISTTITTKEEFQSLVSKIEQSPEYEPPLAFALGVATVNSNGKAIEVFYPSPNYGTNYGTAAALTALTGPRKGNSVYHLSEEQLLSALNLFRPFENESSHPNLEVLKTLSSAAQKGLPENKRIVLCFVGTECAPTTVEDAYLRLHLLSHRLVLPHGINLQAIFSILPNLAWTSEGCMEPSEVARCQLAARLRGKSLLVHSVDKFPRMTDYVVPEGVRICDAIRVRLGAYVGAGTTFMHEGFCNFNAGTEGPNMVEGRISAGVFVGKDTDIGGGASTMGTLSGGGTDVISIGVGTLLGANSGIGISLGDFCTVEAGLYLTAGSVVHLLESGKSVKARELSGLSGLLFRRNSSNGRIEALPSQKAIELNVELHSNQ